MIRVLYVDDEQFLLDICREFIEVPGEIIMDTALSAKEAESALIQKDYDVVVSDYQMPERNGIDFLKDLRSRFGHVSFILFTGRGREEVAIDALNSGADFYLQKGGGSAVGYGQLKKAILQLAKSHATESSLFVCQRRFADLVEEMNAIAMMLDPEMKITYVNPYGSRQLGWGDTLIGTSFVDWLDKARVDSDEQPRHIFLAMFARRGKGETFTHSFRSKNGKKHWVAWTCRFIRNARGTVEEVLLFGTDVTEVHRREAELKRSLSLVKAAFDSTDEGILITGMDRVPEEYNRRFLDMWNIPESVIGLGSTGKLRDMIKDQVDAPDLFLSFLDEVYNNKLDERHWTVRFTDGRKYESFTRPVMIGDDVVGRFWSFKDITRRDTKELLAIHEGENIRGLLDDNKANMLIIDPEEGRIRYANKAAIDFYGYGRERLLGMRITDINTLPPEEVMLEMKTAQKEFRRYFTFKHRLANDDVRDVNVFSGPIEYDGQPMLFSIVHDVTEMQRSKDLVQETELKHNRVLDSLAVGIMVTEQTGKIVYVNQTVQKLLQRGSEELTATTVFDLISEDQKELARQNFRARARGATGHTDYRFIRSDGTGVWALVTSVPIIQNGVFGGTVASVMDITERRRYAEKVQGSEKKFRDIFNNIHDVVMIARPFDTFLEVNDVACARYGYTRKEMQVMSPEDLDAPDTAQETPEKTRAVMKEGSAIFESAHMTKDGRRIPVEINAIVTDYYGEPAILMVCRDITKRKIAEENLAKADAKLRILNGITRHDIMNQLLVLKGNLEQVMNQFDEGPSLERLKKIDRSANTIEYQLQFAKDYQDMGTAPPIFQKLAKVFHNLIEDSEKYAEQPLRIKIGYKMRDKDLIIIYQDKGPGIPLEEKSKIFEMGFGKGSGLGLYLSRGILAITGIAIQETGVPGKGARFEMEVPEGKFRFENEPTE